MAKSKHLFSQSKYGILKHPINEVLSGRAIRRHECARIQNSILAFFVKRNERASDEQNDKVQDRTE